MKEIGRGTIALFVASFLLALLHSCSLDNGILKPSCLIFEFDLMEKWWQPRDPSDKKHPPIVFKADSRLLVDASTDSITYQLEGCNKLLITNHTRHEFSQWTIKTLTNKDLMIEYPDATISYVRKSK